jgi:hypothetical protein
MKPNGHRYCHDCHVESRRKLRAAARGIAALLPIGKTIKSAMAARGWEKRRALHGPNGLTERGRAALAPNIARLRGKGNAAKTYCKHGHKFDKTNTIVRWIKGRRSRMCRACSERIWKSRVRWRCDRPTWLMRRDGWKVNVAMHDQFVVREWRRLAAARWAAHPDKPGGSHMKFLAAQERLLSFMKREKNWYKDLSWWSGTSIGMPELSQSAGVKQVKSAA